MRKRIMIKSISCLVLMGTLIMGTVGFVEDNKKVNTELMIYQAKEINRALSSTNEVVGSWDISATKQDSVTATLYGSGKMVISGTGNMKDYSYSLARPYHNNCTSIIIVEIQDGITSIGKHAFYGCTSLTNVTIPSSITVIEENAFRKCTSLIKVEIPKGVTKIGNFAFGDCSSLKSIIIPEGVTSISMKAFTNCTNLTAVMLPESLTSIGSFVFDGCTNVTIYSKKDSTADGSINLDDVDYINIYNAQPKTTLSNFMKNESLNSTASRILDKDNKELKATDLITTGTSVNNTVEEEIIPYIVLVAGDTNGDGQADLKDILAINKHRLNKAQLTDECLFSGDVNKDGKVDLKDLLQINKYRLGKISTL